MKRTVVKRMSLKPGPVSIGPVTLPDEWDLADLLKDPLVQLEALSNELDALTNRFESVRPQLSPELDVQTFLDTLHLNERIADLSTRLSAYAYLWFSQNTKNEEARAFKARVEERLTALQNRLLFFDLWWQSIDESAAARLLAQSGDLRYHLESIRRFKPHTLSEPEEKIINVKNISGRNAVNTLYDVLTNGLTFTLKVKGRTKSLTREELSIYVRSADPRVREAAYREMYRVFSSQRDVLGEMYITLVNDWKSENVQLRRFRSPIAARNLGNDVPDDAVEALLAVCARNTEVFQRYFRVKAQICGIRPMNRYHIYAPHQAERKRYRYRDAVRMVLAAYERFSPKMAELARRVVEERHLDAKTRPGKLSGAFCYSVVPRFTPYVLLNYTGEAHDIATLAHELGHAVHAMLASDHSIFTFHSTLPLAETASVFGERLLSEALMSQERSMAVKQSLLLAQLDDIYATVLRQAAFVQFEKTAHQMVAGGATVGELSDAYLHNLRQQFGKSIRVPDEFRWEWMTIPHIYGSPFYCYAYSFGNLLVLALYQMYKREGETFVPKYLTMLAAGGSRSPEAILSDLGVDMRSEAFWQSGFDTITDLVTELEQTR
jgi:oligoendopeptidase F